MRLNISTSNDGTLGVNKQGVLVHELAHVYSVHTGLKWQDGYQEQYKICSASNLAPADALLKAPNYAFYYSGECFRDASADILVFSECVSFPPRSFAVHSAHLS